MVCHMVCFAISLKEPPNRSLLAGLKKPSASWIWPGGHSFLTQDEDKVTGVAQESGTMGNGF